MELKNQCRLCLHSPEQSMNLYNGGYASEVNEFFKIKLPKKPNYPVVVCRLCTSFLDDCRDFKNKIEYSQAHLHQVLEPLKLESKAEEQDTGEDIPIKEEAHKNTHDHSDEHEWDDLPAANPEDEGQEDEDLIEDSASLAESLKEEKDVEEEPRRKRSCVRNRESLPEYRGPGTKLKRKNEDDEADWKPGFNPRKVAYQSQGLRSSRRPREVMQAEKLEKELKKKERIAELKKKEKARKPLDALMKKLDIVKCPVCNEPQESFRAIGVHLRAVHKGSNPYLICCGQNQPKDRIYDHMKYHRKKDTFKCTDCGQLCLSGWDFLRHKKEKHASKEDRLLPCPVCGLRFWTEREVNTHLVRRHRPTTRVECTECGKALRQEAVSVHMRGVHKVGKEDFTCHVCGKTFVCSSSFKIHVNNHEKQRSWSQCDICLKFFSNIESHKARVHSTEIIRVECVDCKRMIRTTNLKNHRKLYHSGEVKKHKCTYCPKEFRAKDLLRNHLDIHMGVRHACFFCPETYGATSNRLKHMQKKHTEEYAQYRHEQDMKTRGHDPYQQQKANE